jgi:predicted MPP superfamily phosphohydrolase
MPSYRRAADYSTLRHISEQLQIRLYGRGWMAHLTQRWGWHRPIRVLEHALTLPADGQARPPLRLVFASDFHAGPTTHPQVLAEACAAIAAARPDLLLLGGDFVSLEARHLDALAPLLGAIPAPLGRFAVLGNHDLWADDYPIRRGLAAAGIPVLINQAAQLAAPYEHVWICGLDDPTAGRPEPDRALGPATGTRIVLMHSPEGLGVLQGRHYDLALCGHTHGGQIALPSGRPLLMPAGRFNWRYPHGRFTLAPPAHRTLIVSRGVGYGGLPIRYAAPADIVVCTIGWRAAAG